MRLGLALRTFFRILGNTDFAARVDALDASDEQAAPAAPPRNPALTLLATLQREGRLVDFLQENLDGYADAQVGAAVRDVHRDCAAALERVFGLEALRSDDEDSDVTVPDGFDPAEIRLTGNVTGQTPYRGKLRHAGWRATRCEMPEWTGSKRAAMVVAPAEVEL